MVLGAITGVPTPACLSAASNPVEAVTPPFWVLARTLHWALKELILLYRLRTSLPISHEFGGWSNGERALLCGLCRGNTRCDSMPIPWGAGLCLR